MPVTNSRASTIPSAMKPEKKNGVKQEKEGQDTLDRLIQQSLGKEPFLTFPRSSDSPYQLLQLLNAFDQQESGNLCKSPKEENFEELKENNNVGVSTMPSKKNGIKEPAHSLKGFGQPAKGKGSSSTMQALRIPEAVVAFAQAAAKANGEPEKYLPGWPLLSPKRQMQKCDKCSREYCSTINYRRHMRLHRRSLNVHKGSPKNRDFLGEFWDKLSCGEAKELVSLKCVNLEELSGSSVIKALSTWKRRPAILTSLPHVYVKAGLTLLDIVQASPSVFPVTSNELFSVLDDASENTFLCAGTALSVQKYVFDGEAVKSALEIKNLVAFTSFLIEKELVKAWLADKDAEALRCQKLLVEEEEAAQKRQADLLEAKRLKKLRLKAQKAKDTSKIMDFELKNLPIDSSNWAGSAESSCPWVLSIESTSETFTNQQQHILDHSELSIGNDEISLRLSLHENSCEKSRSFIERSAHENFSPHGMTGETSPKLLFPSEEAAQDMVCKTQRENDHQQQYSLRHAYLQPRNLGNAFWDRQTSSVYRMHDNRDPTKPVTPPNGPKVWSKKIRPENEVVNTTNYIADVRPIDQLDTSERSEVLIGSINVTLKNSDGQHQYTILRPQMENLPKPVSTSTGTNRTAAKLWRRVTHHGNSNSIQSVNPDRKADLVTGNATELVSRDWSCVASVGTVDADLKRSKALIPFPSEVAKAFLAQRWKEALNGEHVVFSSETPSSSAGSSAEEALQAVELARWEGCGRPENQFATDGLINPSPSSLNHKIKPKKDCLKYIPIQKSFEA